MISAGHDTTAYFASYLCYLLSIHQESQDRVRQEMNDVLGDREDLSPDDMLKLSFLQKVMMETLRMYAVVPWMTRRASEDVYVKERDILIRKNTELLIPLFILNRDPELWDKPGDFNPDRFDTDTNFTSAKQGFFPFGYGTRVCIGNTLSQMESAIFLCHLLRRFKLKAVPGFRPAIAAGISLTTLNGVMVEVEAI